MRWLTFKIQHEPGFRFNLIDLILVVTLVATSVTWYRVFPYQGLFLLPIYVGESFFLFCNIFRIGNRLERPWYITFVVIAVYGLRQPTFPWWLLLGVCEGMKWVLIIHRVRRGPYVGALREQLARFRSAPNTI